MLSRRGFLAGTLAAGVASQLRAETGDAAPTVLRIERRDIEVNGKPASVLGIRQPDGTVGITTDVGKPFRVRVENHIEEPSLHPLARAHAALAARWRPGHFRVQQFRREAAPASIFLCPSAAPIGCIRIMDFKSSFCFRRR